MTSPIICLRCSLPMPQSTPSGKCADCTLPYIVVRDAVGNVTSAGCGTLRDPSAECSCTHEPEHHDSITGACHYTNSTYGPCPCAATPDEVKAAQQAAFDKQRAVLKEQGR